MSGIRRDGNTLEGGTAVKSIIQNVGHAVGQMHIIKPCTPLERIVGQSQLISAHRSALQRGVAAERSLTEIGQGRRRIDLRERLTAAERAVADHDKTVVKGHLFQSDTVGKGVRINRIYAFGNGHGARFRADKSMGRDPFHVLRDFDSGIRALITHQHAVTRYSIFTRVFEIRRTVKGIGADLTDC